MRKKEVLMKGMDVFVVFFFYQCEKWTVEKCAVSSSLSPWTGDEVS